MSQNKAKHFGTTWPQNLFPFRIWWRRTGQLEIKELLIHLLREYLLLNHRGVFSQNLLWDQEKTINADTQIFIRSSTPRLKNQNIKIYLYLQMLSKNYVVRGKFENVPNSLKISLHFLRLSSILGNFKIMLLNDFMELPSAALRCMASTILVSSFVSVIQPLDESPLPNAPPIVNSKDNLGQG